MRAALASILVLVLTAGAGAVGPLAPQSSSGQAMSPAGQARPNPSFVEWLEGLRAEALARGISARTIEEALTGIEPLPIVIERDRTQAELTLSLDKYLAHRLTQKMVRTARQMSARHAHLLRRVAAKYGIPPQIIVAVWGLESNFGRFSGVRPTIPTLATLAYDQRRAAFFREELLDALTILDRGDIDFDRMKGSWAGAMGQTQFLPSSYLQYAQDFDGDGRRDIWGSQADVFASIAAYLKAHDWSASQTWGRTVRVASAAAERIAETVPHRNGGCEATRQLIGPLPLSRWRALGVTLSNGRALPQTELEASLVRTGRRSFLVYANYDALLAYNCAHAYALSVALLADRIASR